jgi:hypothetical protein
MARYCCIIGETVGLNIMRLINLENSIIVAKGDASDGM